MTLWEPGHTWQAERLMEEYTSSNANRFLHAASVPLALAQVSPFTPAPAARAEGAASLAIAAPPIRTMTDTDGAVAGTHADSGSSLDPLATTTVVRAQVEAEERGCEEMSEADGTTSACAVYAHGGDPPDEELLSPHLVRLMRNVRTLTNRWRRGWCAAYILEGGASVHIDGMHGAGLLARSNTRKDGTTGSENHRLRRPHVGMGARRRRRCG